MSDANAKEAVHHPRHYNDHPSGVECIDIVEHMPFNIGNAIKYLWRAGIKETPTLEDLEKARWYVEREIRRMKRPQVAITAEIRQHVRDTIYSLAAPPPKAYSTAPFTAFSAHAGTCTVCSNPGPPCVVGRPLWDRYVAEFDRPLWDRYVAEVEANTAKRGG